MSYCPVLTKMVWLERKTHLEPVLTLLLRKNNLRERIVRVDMSK